MEGGPNNIMGPVPMSVLLEEQVARAASVACRKDRPAVALSFVETSVGLGMSTLSSFHECHHMLLSTMSYWQHKLVQNHRD